MFSNLSHIVFADQWVLWLLPAVIALAIAWWYFLARKNNPAMELSSTHSFAGYRNPLRASLKKMLPALRVLTILLLLVAL
ncbi:MAG: BatA domain-containing protein, partial [Chitinophagales bacterium]